MAATAHIRRSGDYMPPLHICAICLRPIAGQRYVTGRTHHFSCPGRPEWISQSVYDRVMVLLGQRFQLYQQLVDAGPDGLSHRIASEHGIPMPGMHLESLIGEGNRIETVETTIDGLPTRLMTLTRDVWAVGGRG